jgi:hypothetical protein
MAATGTDGLSAAYAHIVDAMCQSWVYNCDSGCFYDVCQRQVFTHGAYMCIYQPHKSMMEYEDFMASVFIKKSTGTKKITAKEFKAFAECPKAAIEADLVKSYEDYLESSGGKWLSPRVNGTFESIMQIRKPLELQPDGSLKMSFEIRGATRGCCGDSWTPHYIERNWRAQDPEVAEYKDRYAVSKGDYEDAEWRDCKLVFEVRAAAGAAGAAVDAERDA